MRRHWTIPLMLCAVLLTASCTTLDKGKQVVADAHKAVELLKAKAAEGKAAFDAYMANVETDRAKYEQITGPWDADGDGKVELGEVKDLVVDIAKGSIADPEKRSLWGDGEFWTAIATVLGGTFLGIKAKAPVMRAVHNAGRSALGESDRVT